MLWFWNGVLLAVENVTKELLGKITLDPIKVLWIYPSVLFVAAMAREFIEAGCVVARWTHHHLILLNARRFLSIEIAQIFRTPFHSQMNTALWDLDRCKLAFIQYLWSFESPSETALVLLKYYLDAAHTLNKMGSAMDQLWQQPKLKKKSRFLVRYDSNVKLICKC